MEQVEAISEGGWNPLSEMCSEETDFMAQLLSNYSLPNNVPSSSNFAVSSTFWAFQDSKCSPNGADDSMYSFSQRSCYSGESSTLFPFTSNENCYPGISQQFFIADNNLMSMDDFLNHDVSNDITESKEKSEMPMQEQPNEDKSNSPSESKKRSRVPLEPQRNERNTKLRKCSELDENSSKDNNARQCSFDYFSEDNSNASHEIKKGSGTLNVNGKTRTSRGSATDPQSLYARKRRERINERLRILQNLVPNGTKVDISTMLEEAVQYVKLLQLQIKMLSSDELWMYAPIAYNGMDIGGLI